MTSMRVPSLIALAAVMLWVIFLVSLNLSYLSIKIRLIITILQVFCENEMR